MNIVTPAKNLPSNITTNGDVREVQSDLNSNRRSPRSRKPSKALKSQKEIDEKKLDQEEEAVTQEVEELFLDAKLPADEAEIAPELIEEKTNGYLYLKKGRVQKMYQRYQDHWKEFVQENKI